MTGNSHQTVSPPHVPVLYIKSPPWINSALSSHIIIAAAVPQMTLAVSMYFMTTKLLADVIRHMIGTWETLLLPIHYWSARKVPIHSRH